MARLYSQSLGVERQARLVAGFQQREESKPGVVAERSAPYRQDVLVGTMSAMSDGLQLTKANHVAIIEPHNKPTVVMQAFSRAWRRGQEKTVFVYYIKCTGERCSSRCGRSRKDVSGRRGSSSSQYYQSRITTSSSVSAQSEEDVPTWKTKGKSKAKGGFKESHSKREAMSELSGHSEGRPSRRKCAE